MISVRGCNTSYVLPASYFILSPLIITQDEEDQQDASEEPADGVLLEVGALSRPTFLATPVTNSQIEDGFNDVHRPGDDEENGDKPLHRTVVDVDGTCQGRGRMHEIQVSASFNLRLFVQSVNYTPLIGKTKVLMWNERRQWHSVENTALNHKKDSICFKILSRDTL